MKQILQFLRHAIGLRSPIRIVYHYLRGLTAFALSGNPAKGMYIIGVTGTKGKTTTSTLIATALEHAGKTVGLLSTAQTWIAGEKHENQSKMTMDSPFRLWKSIKEAKRKGVTHLVLETSSHGIYYFRNFGIKYNAVVLTNISQDHLDLHGTMEHYAKTKARIFAPEKGKICVLPKDSEYFELFEKVANAPLTLVRRGRRGEESENSIGGLATYSMSQPATYQKQELKNDENGMHLTIGENSSKENVTIESKLVGVFNAENLLAAYSLLRAIGIETKVMQDAWRDFTGVPGRLERVPNDRGLTVLVDYAHTQVSLRSVLETLRNNKQRIIIVFGATGDRDTTKRPKMGAVAHQLADIVVLTDDDTYTESSQRIIDMVRAGIPREIGNTFQIIPDRREAIKWAIQNAQKGDIVLIAGKGCETAQITNSGPIPWSDRAIAEEFLK